jgi:riboflavin kinase/FMN adenylyltransferase
VIAAIGAFDGFHKGHQVLLERAGERAKKLEKGWGTVTFERHPDTLLVSSKFKSLFSKKERTLLEKYFSVPVSWKMEFNQKVANMTPEKFLDYISEDFGIDGVVVGEGFRFGRNRAGTTELLERECRERGWILETVPILRDARDNIISSTAIRESAAAGDMALVWDMLGHPMFFVNRVVHGNERGRALGFPTANLDIGPEKVIVRYGVYSTLVFASGRWYAGASNIGLNPTFDDVAELRFEVNLQGFSGDLYGREIAVFLLDYVRGEKRFDGPDSLKEQIKRDAFVVKEACERAQREHHELWERFETILPF